MNNSTSGTSGGTRVVPVNTSSRSYEVTVGSGLLDGIGERVRAVSTAEHAFVVTDKNVAPHYLSRVQTSLEAAGFSVASVAIEPGEQHKHLGTYEQILTGMAQAMLTRDDVVIALGGGVVGDLAGFAAATYMRGINVVQVPTTLLSMVDSSVGGKTGLDLYSGKNLVGAFLQPLAVVADVDTLATLEPEVFVDGMGEVVKHAVLTDPVLFERLVTNPLLQSSPTSEMIEVVARNVEIKRDVVNADERERGLRQTLNLGHTLGHAIEAGSGYSLGHGHCVAAGLCCLARATERLGWSEVGLARRIEECCERQGLPTGSDVAHDELLQQAGHDKKRHGTSVNLIVPERLGSCSVRRVSLDELARIIELGC